MPCPFRQDLEAKNGGVFSLPSAGGGGGGGVPRSAAGIPGNALKRKQASLPEPQGGDGVCAGPGGSWRGPVPGLKGQGLINCILLRCGRNSEWNRGGPGSGDELARAATPGQGGFKSRGVIGGYRRFEADGDSAFVTTKGPPIGTDCLPLAAGRNFFVSDRKEGTNRFWLFGPDIPNRPSFPWRRPPPPLKIQTLFGKNLR